MSKAKRILMPLLIFTVSYAVAKAVDDKFRLSSKVRDVIPG